MTTCLRSSCTSFSHKKQKKAKSNANGIAAPATKCSHLLSVVMHPRIACVMGIYRQLTRKRVVRVVVDAGVRTCDHIPNQTSERGPEFTGDFDAPVAQNFFVIGANRSEEHTSELQSLRH